MHTMQTHTQRAMQEKTLNKEKENMKMKKNDETPEILLVLEGENDIITTSGGDTPLVDAFDW